MRAVAVLELALRADPGVCARRVVEALQAEGVTLLDAPHPVYSDFDWFAGVALGDAPFGLHLDLLNPRARPGSVVVLSLTMPPTGPPGVGVCPPLEDTEAARAMLAALSLALRRAWPREELRFCDPGELRGLVEALASGAPA
ncbi:MAG TPA: hypothetical protein PLR99_11195 [Polyangiaceae bacterium]|nr:hypothetical protein [Polyangiaceae bacterium]